MGSIDYKKRLKEFKESKEAKEYLSKVPTTRHEAWLLGTCLATINLVDEIKNIGKILKKKK